MKKRGAVLIVVLGVLAILALLATSFATLQAVERNVSRNYLDMVRAKLLAMSGIQDAVQRLSQHVETFDPSAPDAVMRDRIWRYFGNDVDELGTDATLLRVPLEEAKNPSYAVEKDNDPLDSNPQPRVIKVVPPGKEIGFSGTMQSGTYGLHGDIYSVRITDLQGLIHVNDGLEQGNDGSVSQNLKRILNNLGRVGSVAGLGDRILAARPSIGYRLKRELLAAVSYDESAFNKFKDFVTVRAWQDDKVCNPVPLSEAMLSEYPVKYYRGSPAVYRYGRGKDASGQVLTTPLIFSPPGALNLSANAIYGYDELNPQWIEIVRRAPINVNSAPREVLIAVLEGLKGFFLVERRRNEPPAMQTVYSWLPMAYDFRPAAVAWGGGELGYLYSTVPIQGPGTGTGAVNSWSLMIADEIIACREKKKSPKIASLDYAAVPFGGPFRTWRQFNLFCDRLSDITTGGFLADQRDIFWDHHPTTNALVASEIQKRFASHAIGDVLKANFNPNLHLNETNPEIQLWQRVDKTDLIVNSTEFCFTAMGTYEIESVGRVLRPKGAEDTYLAPESELVALQKVTAIVKLFDVYRETHQADFYKGTLSARNSSPPTNNNLSIEIGPEPDDGVAASENEWSGYLALPTIGGNHSETGWRKTPKTLEVTPVGSSEWGAQMHAHFQFDGRLHHHASGRVEELASEVVANEHVENAPDRTEATPGPYTPLSDGGNRHRLGRSFRMPLTNGGSPPPLNYVAPLDLRIDGMYLERHCGLGYWLDQTMIGSSIGESQGTFSFWVKPGFMPEMTGKPRQFLSADRRHGGFTSYVQPSPFCMWYVASQDAPAYSPSMSETSTPFYNTGSPFGVSPMRTSAFTFGYGYSGASGYEGNGIAEGGCVSPTLNHESHPDWSFRPSFVRGHRWVHVTATWLTKDRDACKIYIDGKLLPGTTTAFYPTYLPASSTPWYTHQDGDQNCVRLGATSAYNRDGIRKYERNWPADATLDEFYWWNSIASLNTALSLGRMGRFYKPYSTSAEESTFTSQEINLLPQASRMPPPPSTGGAGTMPAPPANQVRLMAAQWTLYGEFADTQQAGLPEMINDYHSSDLGTPHPVEVEFSIADGAAVYGPWKDGGFSRLADANGNTVVVNGPFKYKVRFRIRDLLLDSELRATPIVDDITIFYRTREPEFLSYWVDYN